MRSISILLLLTTLICKQYCNAQGTDELGFPFIRNFSPKEYGSSPQVFALQQDEWGVINVGLVGNGIMQYDGRTWRSLKIDKTVYSLAADKTGKIFVGCHDDFGMLDRLSNGQVIFKSLKPDSLKIDYVWSTQATDQRVYFYTRHAFYEYDTKTASLKTYKTGRKLDGGFVHNNTFYLRQDGVGMMMVKDGKLVAAPHQSYFKDRHIYYAIMDFDKYEKLIATSEKGLVRYFIDSLKLPQPFQISDKSFVENDLMFTGVRTADGNFLLASVTKGAILFDKLGNHLNTLNEECGLQNNGIITIMPDQTGNLWLGLDYGLSKTETGLDLSYWNNQNGLKGNVFNLYRSNGTMYVATDQFAYYLQGKQLRVLKDVDPGKQNWIFSEFHYGAYHQLFLGYHEGIYQVTKEKQTKFRKGSACSILFQSKVDTSRMYLSSYPKFLSMRFENNKWVEEGEWNGVDGNYREIIEESDGTLWLGTLDNGIVRVEPNFKDIRNPKSVTSFSTKDGLPSLFYCRPFLIDGKIIIGTSKGLMEWSKAANKFAPYCTWGKEFCDESSSVLLMKPMLDNKLIIAPFSNKQGDFVVFDSKGKNERKIFKPFRRLPEISEISSIWIDNDSVIWVGGSDGLFRYDPKRDRKDYDKSFNCLIRKVSIARDSVISWGIETSNPVTYRLNYLTNTVKFEFAAPFFDREEMTQYSYQLVGMDEEFSPWKLESTKEYTGLSEGTYTFLVKAKNIYDVESRVASFQFEVLPPWYRSWWAYILYVMAAGFFVFIIVRWQTHRLILKSKALEKIVSERTRSLAEKNNELEVSDEELRQNLDELAAINEKLTLTLNHLKAAQNQLIESEKMASLGQLVAGIAHEINNPLNFISGGIQALESIQRELFEKRENISTEELETLHHDTQELMDTISRGIDRTAGIIKSLLTFSSPHEDQRTLVDIKERIQSTAVLLNAKAQRVGVMVSMEFNHHQDIQANASQLGQVFLNMMDNAIQATEQNSGPKNVWISTMEEKENIVIKIKDNGCGIPEQVQSQIFNPFFTTKEVGKGTGLGLSISYSAIKKHQGSITFNSQVGVGTEFIITLPLSYD